MISVSIFNDQISNNLATALQRIREWGYDRVDLRERIFGETVIDAITDTQREALKELLDKYPLTVGCLGTRQLVVRPEALPNQISILKSLIKTARAVKTSHIRICSEDRTADPVARIARRKAAISNFRVLCEMAGEYDVTLVLENKPTSLTNRGSELIEMVTEVDRSNLKVVWDAVNSWQGGFADVKTDYMAVKEAVAIVHLRGAVSIPHDPSVFARSEVLGDDTFPNRSIVEWLIRDHFSGQITLDLSLGQIDRFRTEKLSGEAISRISLDRMSAIIREGMNNKQRSE